MSSVSWPAEKGVVDVADNYTPRQLGMNHKVSTETHYDMMNLCEWLVVRYKFDDRLTHGMFADREVKRDMMAQIADDAARKVRESVMAQLELRHAKLNFR